MSRRREKTTFSPPFGKEEDVQWIDNSCKPGSATALLVPRLSLHVQYSTWHHHVIVNDIPTQLHVTVQATPRAIDRNCLPILLHGLNRTARIGGAPVEIIDYLDYVRALAFEDTPDYGHLLKFPLLP